MNPVWGVTNQRAYDRFSTILLKEMYTSNPKAEGIYETH